ncbi:autotransporter outer membrane beta-barrel domain-containing protein [Humidesulfovibrio idahonensis]
MAGTLRYALTNAAAGDTISFDGSLAGSTITLTSALPSGKGVTFANAAGVTVSYAAATASSIAGLQFASGASVTGALPNVTLTNTGLGLTRGIYDAGSLTLDRLSSAVNVTARYAYAIYGSTGLTVTNGISGSATATSNVSSGTAYGIYGSAAVITIGGISGSVGASATSGTAYAIYDGSKNIIITDGIAGSVTAAASSGSTYGIYTGALGASYPTGIAISGGISGTVSATSTGASGSAYAIDANGSGLSISGGISGTVSATSAGNGSAYGLFGNTTYASSLDGGLSSTGVISATAAGTGSAYAISGGTVTITGADIAGAIRAQAGAGDAYGIYAAKALSIGQGISGSVTATSSAGTASALYEVAQGITAGNISGTLTATSTSGLAYGVYAPGGLTLGDISGGISASGPRAYGLYDGGSTAANIGNITGSVSASSSGSGYYTCGALNCIGRAVAIYAGSSGSLTTGNISGTVSATSTGDEASGYRPYAAGLYSIGAPVTTGAISGTVSATASGSGGNAYGIYSSGSLTTGTISGTISATASGGGTAAGIVATSGSDMTISGTVSATNASPSGWAYAILNKSYSQDYDTWSDTSGVDNITLLSGAKLLGKVDLSGGNDTVTFNSSNVTISGLMDGGTGTDTIALTGAGDFSGYSIANFERLTKSGSGTWTLSQNMDLGSTGATTVNSGTLAVNATLTSPTVGVAGGATLSGAGTIVGDVTNSGTVSPGNTGGTLTVTGNYTQTSGSTLNISLSNTGCSLLDVSGTATLNSGSGLSVAASLTPGYYSNGQSYTFLKAAGGITGSFDTVSITGSTFLNFTLAETATAYKLVLSRNGYTSASSTRNGYNVGQALDLAAVSPGASMQNALALVDFASSSKSASMLDQLGPAAYGAMGRTSLSSMRLFSNAANSQLLAAGQARTNAPGWDLALADFTGLTGGANVSAAAKFAASDRIMAAGPLGLEPVNLLHAPDQNMYLVPIGTYTRQAAGDDATGYKGLTYGLTGGVLIPMDERFGMAVQLGYAHSALDFLNSSSTADIDHFVAGAFGMYAEGGYYGVANVQAGLAYNTMRRRVDFGTSTVTATGHPITYTLGTGIDVGRDYELRPGVWAGPVAGLQTARITNSSFTENGADALNLSVAEDTAYSLKSTLGLRLHSEHDADPGARISTEFSLRWAHEFWDGSRNIRASFEGAPGISFNGLTNAADADAILLGAGVTYKPEGRFAYFAKYNGEVSGERHQAHSVMVGVNVAF